MDLEITESLLLIAAGQRLHLCNSRTVTNHANIAAQYRTEAAEEATNSNYTIAWIVAYANRLLETVN